ncbi:hypothetical protein L195_g002907 [Trifolium pratense]|uniref:CCHC-type domain-containing protein n=1 Tax=Trifolium pratense TaxID=57577 RepID=A0A2K3NTU4_TRIPR|nr:hypothetical protein L195_g002907 [Trifolium pratense]
MALPPPSQDRPPDPHQASNQKCSFRDKLLGNQAPVPRRETVDLIGKNLFRIEFEDGDRRRPRCYADDSVLKDLWLPWQHAIIVKLLGKNIGFVTMRDRLRAVWKLTSDIDMLDIGHGFFMVKFDLEADREKVINGGPWMIFDHYVAIRPWTTDFIASQVKINKTLVWIRFPNLGMEYYDESLLLALATAVGRPIKVDIRTLDASRGKFARVCIEIDLDKPVVGKVWFRDFWYHVEYEGLHLLCKRCGVYGHVARNCVTTPTGTENTSTKENTGGTTGGTPSTMGTPISTPAESPAMVTAVNAPENSGEDLYGEWLVVNRKKYNNNGRNSRANLHGDKAESKENKKFPNKIHKLATCMDDDKFDVSGAQLHIMGSKFHPGESSILPKVWTKTKNKRARGMGQREIESNKPNPTTKRGNGLKKQISFSPHQNKMILARPGRLEQSKAPTQENHHTQLQTQSVTFVGNMGQEKNQSEILVKLPKPPDPATTAGGRNEAISLNAVEDDEEEMQVENPPHRQ